MLALRPLSNNLADCDFVATDSNLLVVKATGAESVDLLKLVHAKLGHIKSPTLKKELCQTSQAREIYHFFLLANPLASHAFPFEEARIASALHLRL